MRLIVDTKLISQKAVPVSEIEDGQFFEHEGDSRRSSLARDVKWIARALEGRVR